jgi:protein O-GlcNAc transferase
MPGKLPKSSKIAESLAQARSLQSRGSLREAETLYEGILAKRPLEFDALHLFGVLRMQQGRPSDALALLSAALKVKPNATEALSNLAVVLMNLDRHQEALATLDHVFALAPTNVGAHFNRGVALTNLGRDADAVESYRKALAVKPDHLEANFNLGNILAAHGRHDEALACYDKVLMLNPGFLDAHTNRGNTLTQLARYQDAVVAYTLVLSKRPDDVRTLNNRATAFKHIGQYEKALADYERVLAIAPHHADALYNRGNAFIDLGRPDEAIASLRRALAAKPSQPDIHSRQAHALFDAHDAGAHSSLIFALNFDPAATTADQQAERARWARRCEQAFPMAHRHGNVADPNRRLRVGYVSSHFRQQAATYAFGGVIVSHDRAQFDVTCYSDTVEKDDVTARLRANVDRWHETAELSDDQLAELIRSDQIDLLIDVVGHMRGNRLPVFARKPAPVQVTAWGEPTGTGLAAMDYLLADPVLVPAAERHLLAERVQDLPNFLGYWTAERLPDPGPLPALSRGYITFGSFNRFAKVLDPVLRSWAAIMRALPQSRLVLKDRLLDRAVQIQPMLAVLAEEHVAPERVTFLDQSDRAGHFAAFDAIDLALDPFPHGGGMTTLDALWMGVPVVTWSGRTISSRLAAANLSAVGLTDFIASDRESYVDLAVAKAGDVEALAQLRATLRSRVENSPVGDPIRYTRAVEAAYRDMWRRWCIEGVASTSPSHG